MKIKISCEGCGKKITIDTTKLPKLNPIALRANKTGMREVFVDCPHCGAESAAEVPIEEKPK
jgi:hypothetical protein